MNRIESGRRGGQALAARVSPLYFEWLGRRGGRRTKRNELLAFAASLADNEPERAAIWMERAERYHDEVGNRVMVELWEADNCEKGKARRRANTWEARLKRWEAVQRAA